MFIRLLFALLVLFPVTLPAAEPVPPPGTGIAATAIAACPAADRLAQLTQTECCKGHKGICGCRAGKIICCDGTTSTQPGCTCHGDEGFTE